MANLAGVVQQLRKERDQAARTVKQLDAALAALTGVSSKKVGNSEPSVCRSTGEDRGCAASTLGKGTGKQRPAEAQIRQHAQEDDVSRRSQEDRRCSAGEMGEDQSWAEEVGVRDQNPIPQSVPHPQKIEGTSNDLRRLPLFASR